MMETSRLRDADPERHVGEPSSNCVGVSLLTWHGNAPPGLRGSPPSKTAGSEVSPRSDPRSSAGLMPSRTWRSAVDLTLSPDNLLKAEEAVPKSSISGDRYSPSSRALVDR
jgi:hypothetical protein